MWAFLQSNAWTSSVCALPWINCDSCFWLSLPCWWASSFQNYLYFCWIPKDRFQSVCKVTHRMSNCWQPLVVLSSLVFLFSSGSDLCLSHMKTFFFFYSKFVILYFNSVWTYSLAAIFQEMKHWNGRFFSCWTCCVYCYNIEDWNSWFIKGLNVSHSDHFKHPM